MDLDAGQWIVIGLCGILIAGYVGGYLYNRRAAEKIVAWLYPGLKRWGQVTPGEPLRGMVTGGRLNVLHPSSPFRTIESIFILEPRENVLFWLFAFLRGQRDELALKLDLVQAPGLEIDYQPGKAAFAAQNVAIQRFLETYQDAITRLTIQRKQPHVLLRARLNSLQRRSGEEFFAALKELNG